MAYHCNVGSPCWGERDLLLILRCYVYCILIARCNKMIASHANKCTILLKMVTCILLCGIVLFNNIDLYVTIRN